MLSERIKRLSESEVRKMFQSARPGSANLSLGQPDWKPSAELVESAKQSLESASYAPSRGIFRCAKKYRKNIVS